MADHLTSILARHDYTVYKYLPYGPLFDCVAYLVRRIEENSTMLGTAIASLIGLCRFLFVFGYFFVFGYMFGMRGAQRGVRVLGPGTCCVTVVVMVVVVLLLSVMVVAGAGADGARVAPKWLVGGVLLTNAIPALCASMPTHAFRRRAHQAGARQPRGGTHAQEWPVCLG